MLPRTIGIDLDDVAIDFNGGLCAYHNALFGTSYERKDIVRYELDLLWKCTPEEAIRRVYQFYHSEEHTNLLPVAGAVEALAMLKRNHSLAIVTARPESVRKLTSDLVEMHFPGIFDDFYFLGHYDGIQFSRKTKGQVCKHVGIELLVEDSAANALTAANEGIPTLLFDAPWNQEELPPIITRVFGWEDALAKIIAL